MVNYCNETKIVSSQDELNTPPNLVFHHFWPRGEEVSTVPSEDLKYKKKIQKNHFLLYIPDETNLSKCTLIILTWVKSTKLYAIGMVSHSLTYFFYVTASGGLYSAIYINNLQSLIYYLCSLDATLRTMVNTYLGMRTYFSYSCKINM